MNSSAKQAGWFHVLVTGAALATQAQDKLRAVGAEITLMPGTVTEDRLLEALAARPVQAILLRGNPPLSRKVLEHAPDLRVIAKHGAGVDTVDVTAATERGVLVMVAGEANAPAVAEHAIALMFALGRDLPRLDAQVHAGQWERGKYQGRELRGRTLGIVGFGRIGQRVAQLAGCLGLRVVALSRAAGTVEPTLATEAQSLDALLQEADIVSLHLPLTAETRHLIDRRTLALMKPTAILINTARGALIDEPALAEALHAGRLAAAGLDTLAQEPPEADSPLLRAPNVLFTPHVAAQTEASILRMALGAAENVAAVLEGRPVDPANVVNQTLLPAASS